MQSIARKVMRSVAMVAIIVVVGRHFGHSDSASSKQSTYSPYSSLMYSPYSSLMSSMYSQYNPMMASSMMMPYYSGMSGMSGLSGMTGMSGYPYSPSMASYGQSSSYHPSQYMSMAASYPQSTYSPLPYAYTGYSPVSTYYG